MTGRETEMEEMNKQNPENIPEEQTQQSPAQNAAANKWVQRKAQRKAKKAYYKQLRKEIREKKWEAYKAKTFLGKTAWVLGKALVLLFVAVTLFTVARVNLIDAGAAAFKAFMVFTASHDSGMEVTREQIQEIAPMDEERGARIDASAPLEEGETWAIYMYMVGSDLETKTMDQLSDVANYMVQREAVPLKQEREETLNAQLNSMVDTILANGMDLPNVMYAKTSGQSDDGGIPAQIAQALISDEEISGGAGSEILRKVMAGTPPENVKIVLQPGGAKAWKSNLVNPNRTQRFVYDSEGMHKVYEGHLSNMADPRTLVDFLTFCEEEYPADHTMLVMFNHGNAAFGYGRDAIYLEDNLTLKEMRWAFEQVYTLDEENPPIDVIGFDACIMASMEVANTLNGVASYMVASEEVEVGYGWDYTIIQNRLAENPRLNPLQLARVAADSYMDPHAGDKVGNPGVSSELCSVLDLKLADDLYQVYSEFASAALEQSAQYAGTAAYLGNTANKSIRFGAHAQAEYNTLDLGMFMQGMEDMLQEEAQAVRKVLDDMVLYNRRGNLVTDATGITVYYPATVSSLAALQKAVKYIEQVCDDPAIRALYYYKVAGCLPEELQSYVAEQGYGEIRPMDPKPLKTLKKTNVTLLEDGNMILPLTDEVATITQEYRYHLLQVDENGIARRLGDSSYLLINEKGELQSAFDGRWVQINGVNLQVKVVSGTPTSLRYAAQVKHNGTLSNLILGVELETQEWHVIGIQPVKETSDIDVMIDRNIKQLNVGDILIPVYEQYDIHTGVGQEITGESITWKADSKVEEGALSDGTYMSYISLVDARGDVYDMQVVSFEIENGIMGNAEVVKMP